MLRTEIAMKSCPSCQRTYSDETLSFCLVDGAILSAPYDPQATIKIHVSDAGRSLPTKVIPFPFSPIPNAPLDEISESNKEALKQIKAPARKPIAIPLTSSNEQSSRNSGAPTSEQLIKLNLALVASVVVAVVVNVYVLPDASPGVKLFTVGALVSSLLGIAYGYFNVWSVLPLEDELHEHVRNSISIVIAWLIGTIISGFFIGLIGTGRFWTPIVKYFRGWVVVLGLIALLSSVLGCHFSPYRKPDKSS